MGAHRGVLGAMLPPILVNINGFTPCKKNCNSCVILLSEMFEITLSLGLYYYRCP